MLEQLGRPQGIPEENGDRMSGEDKRVEAVLAEALPLVGTIPIAEVEAIINEKLERTSDDYKTPGWPLYGV